MELRDATQSVIGFTFDFRQGQTLPFCIYKPSHHQHKVHSNCGVLLPDQIEHMEHRRDRSITTNLDTEVKKVSDYGLKTSVGVPMASELIEVLFGPSYDSKIEKHSNTHTFQYRIAHTRFIVSITMNDIDLQKFESEMRDAMQIHQGSSFFKLFGTHVITGAEFGSIVDYVFQVESHNERNVESVNMEVGQKINLINTLLLGGVGPSVNFSIGKYTSRTSESYQWLNYVEVKGGLTGKYTLNDIYSGRIPDSKQQEKYVDRDPALIGFQIESLPFFLKRHGIITMNEYTTMKLDFDAYCRDAPNIGSYDRKPNLPQMPCNTVLETKIVDFFSNTKMSQAMRRKLLIYNDRIEAQERKYLLGQYRTVMQITNIRQVELKEPSLAAFRFGYFVKLTTSNCIYYLRGVIGYTASNDATKDLYNTLVKIF
jgi:hypothetical protein